MIQPPPQADQLELVGVKHVIQRKAENPAVRGFFLGFPSYWNIVAIYLGLLKPIAGPWPGALILVTLTVLTVLPVRFVYPNLAPRPWKVPTLIGAIVWLALLVVILAQYDHPPAWAVWLSLVYPAFYLGLSVWLDVRSRAALHDRLQ